MPQAGPNKPCYSFEFGPIHILMYSTEHYFDPGSEQHTWVLADLASVNRTRTPWLVVVGHRALYINSASRDPVTGDITNAVLLQKAFAEVFVKYKVDLTLHAHHHSYQRSCPLNADGRCVGPAPSVVSLRSDGRMGVQTGSRAYVNPGGPVHLTVMVDYGYLRMEANGTHLMCEELNLEETVVDALTIFKTNGGQQQHQVPNDQQHVQLAEQQQQVLQPEQTRPQEQQPPPQEQQQQWQQQWADPSRPWDGGEVLG